MNEHSFILSELRQEIKYFLSRCGKAPDGSIDDRIRSRCRFANSRKKESSRHFDRLMQICNSSFGPFVGRMLGRNPGQKIPGLSAGLV
jgi:hypothetical protein